MIVKNVNLVMIRMLLICSLSAFVFTGCNLEVIPSDEEQEEEEENDPENIIVHVASSPIGAATVIDDALTNNKPNAILILTPVVEGGSPFVTESPSVYYYNNKWNIAVSTNMPSNATFNILVKDIADTDAFVHTAVSGSISGDFTTIDHPSLNNNPSAKVFATTTFDYGTTTNSNPIGVLYINNKWAITNLNNLNMLENSKYNIFFSTSDTKSFVHTVTIENVDGTIDEITYLDHAGINGDTNVRILVTPSLGTSNTVYNANVVGVWYYETSSKWTIFNQNETEMPVNAIFNVAFF